MLNSESIVIIRIKGEHLLYRKISGGGGDQLWMGECLLYRIVSPGEYVLYSKISGGKVYYIANIPRGKVCYAEGLLCDTGTPPIKLTATI